MLNCIIYQIKCLETGEVYIGSTTRTINERMYEHTKPSNKCISKNIINRGNFKSQVLLYFTCYDNKQRDKIEGNFITSEPNCINKSIPARNGSQYREDNKYHLREKTKIWHRNNQEKSKTYNKKWKDANKEKVKQHRRKWIDANKDKLIAEYRRKQALKPTKEEKKASCIWRHSWGGDPRQHNNLLRIDISIFHS